ncbi:response regulator transcription factor [uncultured Acetatifactor sp.]|jgi:two-component system KDP operon response regulator KdpE|uniref:response regulator transcription factor n=1 Tax=uncultured Acetatifactor sp. TaxID=1671927 RepID=UPI0026182750|nr:response regulator transcription factor [uncultured Acetatifactor sp.]MCI8696843.1 response regulator transcription factor [Lachnospiraceae bacterium]
MNARIRILLIEDNKNTCSYISALLAKNGYTTTTALTGREGLSLAASLCPNLILLDLGLPDMDGFQVLEQLRGWSHVPILIVSACNEEQEKVAALDLGADDYITKPFYPNELTARIRTALRHSRGNAHSQVYKALNLEIDFDKRILRLEGKRVHLTQIEYQLLSLLAENAGRVLTYNTILRRIWGPYAEENNQILRVNMANIRRKIEQNPAQPQYVFTEVGVGYRMLENENG